MPEKSICTKCEDGWMVKAGDRLVCSHCGEEEPPENPPVGKEYGLQPSYSIGLKLSE